MNEAKLSKWLPLCDKYCHLKTFKKTEHMREEFTRTWLKVWLQEGYIEAKQKEHIVNKYGKYDKKSTDFLVKIIGTNTGTMRVIEYDAGLGLPTLNDFQFGNRLWTDINQVVEVTLLTSLKVFRRLRAPFPFMKLMKALYWHTLDYEGILIAADIRLAKSLTKKVMLPFQQIGEAIDYEGSLTVPMYMPLKDDNGMRTFERVFSKNNPLLAQWIMQENYISL